MPTPSLAELEAMVGESHVTVESFCVEAGKVEEFARAIRDDNPAHRDPDAAREQGFDRVPAPLTFVRTSTFPRYEPDEGGGEAGRDGDNRDKDGRGEGGGNEDDRNENGRDEADRDGDDGNGGFDLGFDPEYVVHGEQSYEFERPLFVGDELTGTTTLTDVYRREGRRGGQMTFAELETVYRTPTGDRVVTARATVIETGGAIDD